MTSEIKKGFENQAKVMGHPAGLFVLFFTEMWERFSYYGMRALLVLFLVSAMGIGGWEWAREDALYLYAIYTGLVYITPIFGGLIADKITGFRVAILIGALLMTLGHAAMAFETETTFYLGLGLLILGNGLFKPNISSVVGGLYKGNEDKKDAAYTIFYMGINAGAFLGILLCGYIGEKAGWSYGFGLAGIFMLFGMIMYYFSKAIFKDVVVDGKPNNGNLEDNYDIADSIEEIKKKPLDKIAKDRLTVIGILAFFTIFFWMAFEQAGGSMTIFAKDYTNRILEGGWANFFTIINTIITIVPLAIITYVLFLLVKATYKKIPISNLFLSLSFIIIWGIVGWMVNRELNSKSYEIAYQAVETSFTKESLTLNTDRNDKLNKILVSGGNFDMAGESISIDSISYNGLIIKTKSSENEKEQEKLNKAYLAKVNSIENTGNAKAYYTEASEAKTVLLNKLTFQTLITETTSVSENEKIVNKKTTIIDPSEMNVDDAVVLLDVDQKGSYRYMDTKAAEMLKADQRVPAKISKIKDKEVEVPASWFGILNSLFIICFAPLFSKLWESKYNPSAPVKFAVGLILLGLGFGILALGSTGIKLGAATASVSMVWLILAYLLHTLGELTLSPVGLSYVSKLAPEKLVGLMFGVWFGATALANYIAGWTGSYIDQISESIGLTGFFLIYTALPIVAGLILMGMNKFLIKKMHGIR